MVMKEVLLRRSTSPLVITSTHHQYSSPALITSISSLRLDIRFACDAAPPLDLGSEYAQEGGAGHRRGSCGVGFEPLRGFGLAQYSGYLGIEPGYDCGR
jgi:hypothetical protein